MTRCLRGKQNRPLSATACELLVVAEARLRPCPLRRPDETGLGWGASDPATRHPVTERSEVEVPRSDIIFGSCNISPGTRTTTTSDDNTRLRSADRRGVEERQRSRDNIPGGKALGDGRRPAVGLPEGRPHVLYHNTIRYDIMRFTFTPHMALSYNITR